MLFFFFIIFFFQAEDGIRDLVRSRGLGDVYKRQRDGTSSDTTSCCWTPPVSVRRGRWTRTSSSTVSSAPSAPCLLYTSDAADERSSVDLGGRRIIKKNNKGRTDESERQKITYTELHDRNHKRNNDKSNRK